MSKNDGGPVHPVHGYQMDAAGAYCGQWVANNGMTLRDYFAAKALQSMILDPEYGDSTMLSIAQVAYRYADAMLKARNQ